MAKEEWSSTVGKKQGLRFGCSLGLYECNGAERLSFCAVNYWTKRRMYMLRYKYITCAHF